MGLLTGECLVIFLQFFKFHVVNSVTFVFALILLEKST